MGEFYRLIPDVQLRGWQRLPYALVHRGLGKVNFLNKAVFGYVSLFNGLCDISIGLVPQKARDLAAEGLKQGWLEKLDAPAPLNPDQEYRFYDNRFIRTIHWSITGKCNYRCKHCYMSAPEAKLGELAHQSVMDIIEQMADCGVINVTLTGGEPLVRSDFWEIVDALQKHKIRITQIYSNGRLVNEALLDGLLKRGLQPEFNMSYDGDEGWHDWMRGIPEAGKIVLDAFDLCHAKGFPTGSELCLHKGNRHLLRQSLNTLAAHQVGSCKVNPVADTDLWRRFGADYSISIPETLETYLEYAPHFFEDGMPISLMLGGFFFCRKGEDTWEIPMQKYDKTDQCLRQTVCGHARMVMYLSPEGRMLPCMSLSGMEIQKDYPLISEIGLRKGMSDSKYMELIDTRVEALFAQTPECGKCEYAKICAGGCRASGLASEPDNIFAPDRAACAIFREGYAKRLEAALRDLAPHKRDPWLSEM